MSTFYTECANHSICKNDHSWNSKDFDAAIRDRDKMKIILCKDCFNSNGFGTYWGELSYRFRKFTNKKGTQQPVTFTR